MTEPDVTLTDYALVLECAVFATLLYRGGSPTNGLRFWFVLLFTSVSFASLLGGTVHGFFLDEQSLGQRVLWPMTLMAIGITALSGWAIGARLLFSPRGARWVTLAANLQLAGYSAAVLFWSQEFRIAVLNNVPAMLFLLVALAQAYRRERDGWLARGAAGMALMLISGLGQQLRIGIHPVYFNHNALYHVLQGVSLFLVFIAGRRLVDVESGSTGKYTAGPARHSAFKQKTRRSP